VISKRQWQKVLETERLYRECVARGFHVRSGERSTAIMGGKPYEVERCADCGVRSTIDDRRWAK
jgi:hypothetical protein